MLGYMGDSFAKQHCRAVVCHIMQSIGFHNAWSIPIDGLACLLANRIYAISKAMSFFCHAFGRTEPILDDVGLVFSWMGISLSEIVDYLNQVEMVPPVHAVPQFPVERPIKLRFCSSGVDDDARAPYVPEYIPLLTPAEVTKQEKATGDESVEMLKSLQLANEQQACRTSLLSELEKLDAFSAGLVAYEPPPLVTFNEPPPRVKEQPVEAEVKASSPSDSPPLDEPLEAPLAIVEQPKKLVVNKVPPFRLPKPEPKRPRRVRPSKPPPAATSAAVNRRREKVEWGHIKDVISEVLEQATKKHKTEETTCTEDAGVPCPLRDIYDSVINDTFHVTPAGPSTGLSLNRVPSITKKAKKPMKQNKVETFAEAKMKPTTVSQEMEKKSGAALTGMDSQGVSAVEREKNVSKVPPAEKENEPKDKITGKPYGGVGDVPPPVATDSGTHNPLRITLKLSSLQLSKEKKKKKKVKAKCKLGAESGKQPEQYRPVEALRTEALSEEKKVPKLILKLPVHQAKVKKERSKRAGAKLAKNTKTMVEPLTVVTEGLPSCSPPGPSSRHSDASKTLRSPSLHILPSPVPPTPSPGSSSHNSPLHVDLSPMNRADPTVHGTSQCGDDSAAPAGSSLPAPSPKRPQQYSADWYCPVCFKGDREDVDMVCCDSCNCWFHYDCVGLQAAPSTPAWFCERCAALRKDNLTIK